jgi:hypothetical protein
MIEIVNKAANVILLFFCIWAVLEKRCKTRLIGTFTLSLVGLAAFAHIIQPLNMGFIADYVEVVVNVVVASAVIWYWLKWQRIHHCTEDDHAPD